MLGHIRVYRQRETEVKVGERTRETEVEVGERTREREVEVGERTRETEVEVCLLYTSPSPRDSGISRMPSSA